ncbi:glycoside hydrolase family 19 protein, partial [Flavobacterium psychrophilum]|nr:glycoside hydrolase family 19 protein [Flavobacterium psychrophilum]
KEKKEKKKGDCPNCDKEITEAQFKEIFPDTKLLFQSGTNSLSSTSIQQFVTSLNKAFIEFEINTCTRKAYLLSQIARETGDFNRIDEDLDYRTKRALHSLWSKKAQPKLYSNPSDYFKNPEKLGNYVYRDLAENGNEVSGDGYKFRGRGLIQITRKKGYRRFGTFTGKDLLTNPDLLLNDLDLMVRSACWYWTHGVLLNSGAEKNINGVADNEDFTEATRLVHGSTVDVGQRTITLNKVKPVLKTNECKKLNSVSKILSDAHIEYHIFHNKGEIFYKLQNEDRETASYYYHDSVGDIHDLGKYKLNKVKDAYGGNYSDKIKGNNIYLFDIQTLKNYEKGSVKFKLDLNTNRYFMNDVTLASLLGAMLDCSFEDFVFNGFSNELGQSVGGSESHKNGMNGDLRYLRKDKSGKRLHLSLEAETGDPCGWKGLDEIRQNKFNDALYKFGWKKMLSWKYNKKTLNHATHYDDHHDHLHLQSYTPKLKKI